METAGYILIIIGLFLNITAALGILRFSNFFERLHPAGITDSLGAPLAILGVILLEGFKLVSFKLFFLILLIYLTSPTACHALAKAAYFQDKNKKS